MGRRKQYHPPVYKIEEDIPIPSRLTDDSPEYLMLNSLKVNASFTFKLERNRYVLNAIQRLHREGSLRFIWRTISKNPPLRRVWRIKDGTVLRVRRDKTKK